MNIKFTLEHEQFRLVEVQVHNLILHFRTGGEEPSRRLLSPKTFQKLYDKIFFITESFTSLIQTFISVKGNLIILLYTNEDNLVRYKVSCM